MSGTRYDALTKNETVLRKKTGEKIQTISDDTGISESSIRGWCKEYEQNGEFKDNNNNDAIPSWSGYNYQGKAMILCVLQKIRFILESNLSLANWSVELEKLQDFVLKNDSSIISLWQVKATLAKNKVIGYSDALEKLLSDKLISNSKTAECYIISAADIIDWNEEENKYNKDVKLYKYSNEEEMEMSVGLLEIPQYIKFELRTILLKMNINLETEKAYLGVCNYINEIVAKFHLQGKSANYEIYFE